MITELACQNSLGASLSQSYYLALLAEAYGKAGQTEEGLAVLAEALTLVDKSGERFYEAELYRLKGNSHYKSCQSSVLSCQLPIPDS